MEASMGQEKKDGKKDGGCCHGGCCRLWFDRLVCLATFTLVIWAFGYFINALLQVRHLSAVYSGFVLFKYVCQHIGVSCAAILLAGIACRLGGSCHACCGSGKEGEKGGCCG